MELPENGACPLSPTRARVRSTVASILDQPEELRALRAFHKTLADVNRLRIVQRLAHAEASITDLIDHVGLSQPLVSWHVGRLRAAGLVETRRVGRETICRLLPHAFEASLDREREILGIARPDPARSAAS